jgi:nucleotide-binding universal stress UspA family protein
MPDVYVVGFDGTAPSHRAAEFAASNARKAGAALHLVMVLEWSPYSFLTIEELAERHKRRQEELARADAVLAPVVQALRDAGAEVTGEVRYGHAAEVICEIIATRRASQVFIGRTGGSPLAQRLLGGLVLALVQAAPAPVTVVP